jgi:hypothetical protein
MFRFPKRFSALFLVIAGCAFSDSFSPNDVKIAGDLKYGDTSAPVECGATPKYYALVFNGNSGDRVEVTVTADGRRAEVAIADPTLLQLASGTTNVTTVLPNRGPDMDTYYIVFRDSEAKPARFVVQLKKLSEASK